MAGPSAWAAVPAAADTGAPLFPGGPRGGKALHPDGGAWDKLLLPLEKGAARFATYPAGAGAVLSCRDYVGHPGGI